MLMCIFTAGVSCSSQWIMWNSYLIIWWIYSTILYIVHLSRVSGALMKLNNFTCAQDWEWGMSQHMSAIILASSSLRTLATTSHGFKDAAEYKVGGWRSFHRPEAPVSRRAPEGTYHTSFSWAVASCATFPKNIEQSWWKKTHGVQCACRRWCWNISFPLLSEARPENPSAAAWPEIYMKLAACIVRHNIATSWDMLARFRLPHLPLEGLVTSSPSIPLVLARKDECSNFLQSLTIAFEARTNFGSLFERWSVLTWTNTNTVWYFPQIHSVEIHRW